MSWYKYTIPLLVATLTNHPRYKVEVEWSSKSWTHNLFRVWEMIAYRREGIRFESSAHASVIDGETVVTYSLGSWESIFAHAESGVRGFLKGVRPRLVKVPLPIPVFAGGYAGIDARGSYVFAIAFDAFAKGSGQASVVTSITFAHTCTGTNLMLVVPAGLLQGAGSETITSATYNAVGMTQDATVTSGVANHTTCDLHHLVGPATGANNVVVTISALVSGGGDNLHAVSMSYTGVNQTGQPDSAGTNGLTASVVTNFPVETTVVGSACWLVGGATEDAGEIAGGSPGAGTTYRGTASNNMRGADSDGIVATGSVALNYGRGTSAGNLAGATLSMAEVAVAAEGRIPPLFMLLGVGN